MIPQDDSRLSFVGGPQAPLEALPPIEGPWSSGIVRLRYFWRFKRLWLIMPWKWVRLLRMKRWEFGLEADPKDFERLGVSYCVRDHSEGIQAEIPDMTPGDF